MMRYQEAEINVREIFQGQQMVSPIEIYSRLVQDEITFVYYINLVARYHGTDLPFMKELLENPQRLDDPYEIVTRLLKIDGEIEERFTNWMKDIRQYQNEIFENITNYVKTKQFVFKEERIGTWDAK
jgi:hypothetical protein